MQSPTNANGSAPNITQRAAVATTITIRQATKDDLAVLMKMNDIVQELHALLLPTLFKDTSAYNPPPSLYLFLTDKKFTALVACDGDTPVGYIAMSLKNSPSNDFYHARRYACIHHIAVCQTHRRKGVGKILMNSAKAAAQELRATRLELDVFSINLAGKRFFAAEGFLTFNESMEVLL